MNESWTKDILGSDFEQLTISQPDDYEGKVVCTLIRKKSTDPTDKAVLYVHGFNDYFFQKEMAGKFNENSYDFYAIDLRKSGRSYLPHQKLNNLRHVSEYYADLDKALEYIKSQGHTKVLLSGHSTGGLIVSLYANDNQGSQLFQAVYVNSPNYAFNNSYLLRNIAVPLISALGKYMPDNLVKGGFSPLYGPSLYKGDKGEWEYNLTWKPHVAPLVSFGFIRAIHQAHKKVRKGLKIDVPVLVMHSDNSLYEKEWSEKLFTGDVILNVRHIRKLAEKIQGDVTIQIINGGMHDLILSPKPVRELAYNYIFEWLKKF